MASDATFSALRSSSMLSSLSSLFSMATIRRSSLPALSLQENVRRSPGVLESSPLA
eukprot:CAMPEP_0175867762 /NCGR_PEP_ID=MMETSP0107_2-20121207/35007_1 /TAXON_ID=195067 ORGANISM="Goniomonas pacifica, Strain CCMP1869" /NCGR_SAMPLE_ID=MMETSP0107_2 /ASSEMBLY_ACC=CAM_ASM_000203 /LENGTH=55 /DNA_ID=CAMNT_0017185561 /DNA_START=128 /DNA_END=292 /DNA_ORIENTATION=-